MAAILGLDDFTVEDICERVSDVVVPANYNCPGQVVVSGTLEGALARSVPSSLLKSANVFGMLAGSPPYFLSSVLL